MILPLQSSISTQNWTQHGSPSIRILNISIIFFFSFLQSKIREKIALIFRFFYQQIFSDRKQENWSLQIESRRTGVYRQKVGELDFTDRKQENWSLQIESRRTGGYRQKVGELEFTDRSVRTGVCKLVYFFNKKQEFTAFCSIFRRGPKFFFGAQLWTPTRDNG